MLGRFLTELCAKHGACYDGAVRRLNINPRKLNDNAGIRPDALDFCEIGRLFGMTATDVQFEYARYCAGQDCGLCRRQLQLILFNPEASRVLLSKKRDGCCGYACVGGWMDPQEPKYDEARRVAKAAAGILPEDMTNLACLGSVKTEGGPILSVSYFTAVVDEDAPSPCPIGNERLEWHAAAYIESVPVSAGETMFSGPGCLPHFICEGVRYHLKNDSMGLHLTRRP